MAARRGTAHSDPPDGTVLCVTPFERAVAESAALRGADDGEVVARREVRMATRAEAARARAVEERTRAAIAPIGASALHLLAAAGLAVGRLATTHDS